MALEFNRERREWRKWRHRELEDRRYHGLSEDRGKVVGQTCFATSELQRIIRAPRDDSQLGMGLINRFSKTSLNRLSRNACSCGSSRSSSWRSSVGDGGARCGEPPGP